MKLSIGIVGLPNVGKSTLFKLLTKQEVNIANYPFATIDPNIGVVSVPDERLEKLAKMSNSKKTIPAIVEFYDIAGLVKGAYKGEGLGNQFLSHIREVSAIAQVVRCFSSNEIIHVEQEVNPMRDLEIINTELILKDLETAGKYLANAEKDVKSGKKEAIKEMEILKIVREQLNHNKLINQLPVQQLERLKQLKYLNFLTAKPQIYLLNGPPPLLNFETDSDIEFVSGKAIFSKGGGESDINSQLIDKIKSLNSAYLVVDLAEASIVGINDLIKKTYKILGLISFFTTGEDESRAWTIKEGTKAAQAAGEIHSDFEKKFIRAEVINLEKLLEACSWNNAKQKGWLRLEGKDYIVSDGDVMIIRHG